MSMSFATALTTLDTQPIPGYEGLYSITKDGNVLALALRKTWMHPNISNCGYSMVLLWKDGVRKRHLVHRLVAQTYIPNPHNLPQVNHIDGNKANNNIDNLEWCTAKSNVLHAYRTGLRVSIRGERHGNTHLNESRVIEMRQMHKDGKSYKELGALFNLAPGAVGNIVRYKRWGHVL